MTQVSQNKFNTIASKYPSHRDELVKGCWKWMKGRRADDNAEGLWRIGDKLYDLNGFIERHPGGREWLVLSKGTDITEAFEVFHLSSQPSEILKKYYMRDAKGPRNYRFTFHDDDFYKTLRRKVIKKLNSLDIEKELWKSKVVFDLLLFGLILAGIAAVGHGSVPVRLLAAGLAGLFATFLINCGHNFVHMKNNWRMYGCHVMLINFREFRVFHAMSHHLYPNSVYDFEASIYEPFVKLLPGEKTFLRKLINYAMVPVAHFIGFHVAILYRTSSYMVAYEPIFYPDDLIGLGLPLLMFLIPNYLSFLQPVTIWQVFLAWNLIVMAASVTFQFIAITVGHHGTKIIHEGDEFKSLDFGIYQLAATIDRYESDSNFFMALTHFGEHILHHLFPTLDHSILYHFHKELDETCREFDEELRKTTFLGATVEHCKHLARTSVTVLG